MILTTYFSMVRHLPKDIEPISIARKTPTDMKDYPNLFPPAHLLRAFKDGDVSVDEYKEVYNREVLSRLRAADVYDELDGKALVCYEKSSDFCHRHLVSAWLRENGFDCHEFERANTAHKESECEQLSLFDV